MQKSKPYALIADDHPIFREGLKNAILKTYKFCKIEEAANGKEAIDLVMKIPQIGIIFMDIEMPIMNGVEAAKLILNTKPNIKIIVTTMFSEPKYIKEMVKLNVSGYLLKDSNIAEITKAIEMVTDNQPYYSPKVQELIINAYKDINQKKVSNVRSIEQVITTSQKQVLELLCQQYSNLEIALQLNLSELTVKRHRQDLLERIGAKNLAGLIIYAIENNIYKVNVKQLLIK
jgi:DNA-binding NarL/FixJ family response regulator